MTAVFGERARPGRPDLATLELPGTWVGTGFSSCSRPDKHDNKFFLR